MRKKKDRKRKKYEVRKEVSRPQRPERKREKGSGGVNQDFNINNKQEEGSE